MRFGVHTFLGNVSQQALTQSAPLLIGHFYPASFVGFYALPQRLLQYTSDMTGRIGVVTNTQCGGISVTQWTDEGWPNLPFFPTGLQPDLVCTTGDLLG